MDGNHHFPMVFPIFFHFSQDVLFFRRFSSGFPMISYGFLWFPMVFQRFSHGPILRQDGAWREAPVAQLFAQPSSEARRARERMLSAAAEESGLEVSIQGVPQNH